MSEPEKSADPLRARRVLAWTPVLFVAAQLAVGLCLDRAPLEVRFRDGVARLERARSDPPPDVLLFGSSRFKALVRPEIVEDELRAKLGARAPRVASLAFDGGDLVGTSFMLDQMLASGARPKLAVIEVTPEWLRHPIPFLNGQLLRIFTWSDVVEWFPELVLGTRRTLLCARLFPVYCYRKELLTWMVGRSPPYLAAPSLGVDPPPRPPDDPAHGVHRWTRILRGYEVGGRGIGLLRGVLGRCRDAGIACVLVVPPVSSAHRALLDGRIEERFAAALARVREEHPVPLFDGTERLGDDGFRDSTHGNRRGAELFSRMVADEVIAPRWAGP